MKTPKLTVLRVHFNPTFPLNIPMSASVPRKPVPCPVLYWLEADLCPLQMLNPQKGLPAKVKTHRRKKRRRGRRKSTKSGLAQGRAPPSITRPPNPGPGPTRKQSTVSPVPIGRHGAPGGFTGRPWRGALLPQSGRAGRGELRPRESSPTDTACRPK